MTATTLNTKVADWLPEGESGEWSIRRFKEYDEPCTGFFRGADGWMNDCAVAVQEHQAFVDQAHGDVVLTGLGIGFLPAWLIQLGRCRSITIVEYKADVINLVWKSFCNNLPWRGVNVRLVHADADLWLPLDPVDCVWVDHKINPLTLEERERMKLCYAGKYASIHFWERM